MKKVTAITILLFVVIDALFVQSGCGPKQEKTVFPKSGLFRVSMINNSDQEVHMWVSGAPGEKETIGAGNKLEAGTERYFETVCSWKDEFEDVVSITVSVGKNGQVITSSVLNLTYDKWYHSYCPFKANFKASGAISIISTCK